MSRGQNPLMLMMALSLPGAAHALGLGEIHVDSALNEPLAAEIDIVGASAEELAGLTASIASRETFLKFGADRPQFLSTATFKVAHDVRGRPVLSIRSTDSFTEPVVNLVVDLRWHNGEVLRQYSLLLDPAGFPSAIQTAAALPVTVPVAAAVKTTLAALPAPPSSSAATSQADAPAVTGEATAKAGRTMTHVKIGSKATLRGVAWRVGARSDADLNKTMLAVFRANPSAFEGNINRLHLGATLTIPSQEIIDSIPTADAKREIRAQMASWRALVKGRSSGASSLAQVAAAPNVPVAQPATAPMSTVAVAAPVMAAAPAPVPAPATTESDAALNLRIHTLEQGLQDVQGQLQREHDQLLGVQAQVKYAAQATVDASPAEPTTATVQSSKTPWILGGLTLLAGALAAIYRTLRRRPEPVPSEKIDLTSSSPILERSSDPLPAAPAIIAEPAAKKESTRTPQRPIMTEDGLELSAAWNSVRDKQEAKTRAQLTAAMTTAVTPRQSIITATEEELRAAYEDTLDLSSETAILSAEIAAASAETVNLPASTVNLQAEAMRMHNEAATAETGINETVVMDPGSASNIATISLEKVSEEIDPTVEQPRHAGAMEVDVNKLDYNLLDLDLSAHHHVQMPSMLHEQAVVKERRTNLIDVLKMAIEREPDRSDLRMKLLETYYAAASTNRQGFLEVVQKLARERERLGDGEWEKIAFMGKQIASDTALFSAEDEDDELADCA